MTCSMESWKVSYLSSRPSQRDPLATGTCRSPCHWSLPAGTAGTQDDVGRATEGQTTGMDLQADVFRAEDGAPNGFNCSWPTDPPQQPSQQNPLEGHIPFVPLGSFLTLPTTAARASRLRTAFGDPKNGANTRLHFCVCTNTVPPLHEDNKHLGSDNAHLSSKCVRSRHVWKPAEGRAGKPLEKPGQNLASLLLVTQKQTNPTDIGSHSSRVCARCK
jgi:hypothetical protein